MPGKFSTQFSYHFLIILLVSQHTVMNNRCIDVNREYRNGKKLPGSPLVVLFETNLHRCVTECDLYMFCLSVNFNRKLRICELNSQKASGSLSLADDDDVIYRDIPGVVSVIYLLSWHNIKKIHVSKLDKTFSKGMLQKQTENIN
jgi:hypothetical protein